MNTKNREKKEKRITILADAWGCPNHFNGRTGRRCSCRETESWGRHTNVVYDGPDDEEKINKAREVYFYGWKIE
jgi:hypothetical protein